MSTRNRLSIDISMNVACRNCMALASTPAGIIFWSAGSIASICRVMVTVSALGCFCTARITPGLPLKPASPRFVRGAKSMSATWLRATTCPSR
jgi:hypothetical protein